ncbi:hypothetical protein HDV00_008589, partial [Rhizophlyctis rosea]
MPKSYKQKDIPCRINLHLDGFEWFIYNRTPAYDIVEQVLREHNLHPTPHTKPTSTSTTPFTSTDALAVQVEDDDPKESKGEKEKDWLFRKLLPISVEGTQGAVMLGNPDLETIVTVGYKEARGVYEVVE